MRSCKKQQAGRSKEIFEVGGLSCAAELNRIDRYVNTVYGNLMAEVRQRSSRGIDATKGMEGNKEMEV
ncbi:hypothetical protein FA13DRAFT_1736857, partial [Coprinellus micaceus]